VDRFPEARHIRRALERTREGLDLPPEVALNPEHASVFLKYLLLEISAAEPLVDIHSPIDRLSRVALTEPELAAAVQAMASAPPIYRTRLLELVDEARLGERLAPEVCLCPGPQHADTVLGAGGHRHAVVFAATAGFSHEFYPLAVDAYVSDALNHERQPLKVLGVRADWLDGDDRISRALVLDAEHDRLLETDWTEPFHPDSVQLLCLGTDEHTQHRQLSQRFVCLQINPYQPSALADDKAATVAGWSRLGLPTPASGSIKPGGWSGAIEFAAEFTETVVKPNGSTEGSCVALLRRDDPDFEARLRDGLERCWLDGPALLQQRRDGVAYRDPVSGRIHSLILRLNVVFDGERHRLVSGFAQLGIDANSPASCGRGGRILRLDQALSALVMRTDDGAAPMAGPDHEMWLQWAGQAEQAAGLFGGLGLVGLDMLLDIGADGGLAPVFLEANPRPAGLSHSRLLTGLPSSLDQAGVGPDLWSGVRGLK
jgi:hypothetical protein